MSLNISNVIESNVPVVSDRNYAPTRTFVTKWDVEIENNRTKKISRGRERDTKYFEEFDQHGDSLPPIVVLSEYEDTYSNDDNWELEGESEQGWLRSVHAENAYYDRKYGELKGNFEWYDMNQPDTEPVRKRFLEFDEQSLFKRVRA
jgi:hypothetical protein